MRTVSFQTTDLATSGRLTHSVTLSLDEIRLLEEFCAAFEEVAATRFVKNGMPARLQVKVNEEGVLSHQVELPEAEDLSAFLHRMRPILLHQEPFSFNSIRSLLGKHLTHPMMRQLLRQIREDFEGKRLRSQVEVQFNGVLINSDEMLKKWLNAFEYHRDRDKREALEALHKILPIDASKVIFISMLTHKLLASRELAQLAALLLGRSKSVRVGRISGKPAA